MIKMAAITSFLLSLLGMSTSRQGDLTNYITANEQNTSENIYKFTLNDIDDNPVNLSVYEGKVLILVNVASKCGLTPQYKDIEAYYKNHKDKGVVVLAFPANNFLSQEPGTDEEIKDFCSSKYGITFPIFSKISVKGKNIHPLYKFLTTKEENGVMDSEVKWNFQKYLVDRQGRLVTFFDPKTGINDQLVTEAVSMLLKKE
jgi:glutathione peroxidase